jgi:phosphinothricin acetyltransferase
VREDCQGHGVGRALLSALLSDAKARNFLCLIALITADNVASLHLHRRSGFIEVGTLRRVGQKFGKELDVVTLQILLDEAD